MAKSMAGTPYRVRRRPGSAARSGEPPLLPFDLMDVQERAAFTAASDAWMLRGGGIDIVTEGPLATEEMILNIGPQHPSTHGVLRVVLELDGERIIRAEPVIGYMHRAAEKLSEYRDPRQVLVLMNRHDWLSAFNNELGWVIAIERMLGIEVPERAQWIRTMMAEWNRILNHLMFTGSSPLELGAMTPVFYACRWRSTGIATTGCSSWASGCGSRARSSNSAWTGCPRASTSLRSCRRRSRPLKERSTSAPRTRSG